MSLFIFTKMLNMALYFAINSFLPVHYFLYDILSFYFYFIFSTLFLLILFIVK